MRSGRSSSKSRRSRSTTATSPRCSPTTRTSSGEIAGLQREPRGTLYHPHLRAGDPAQHRERRQVPPAVLDLQQDLVYIEKAGTQQNLIEVGWPEEYDARHRERRRLHHPRRQGPVRPARDLERAGHGVLRARRRRRRHDDLPHAGERDEGARRAQDRGRQPRSRALGRRRDGAGDRAGREERRAPPRGRALRRRA